MHLINMPACIIGDTRSLNRKFNVYIARNVLIDAPSCDQFHLEKSFVHFQHRISNVTFLKIKI